MTNFHLKPPTDRSEKPAWLVVREQRKKQLAEIRKRRAQQYKQFVQKNRRLQPDGHLL